ncbi:PaRep2b protein [Flagellimonas profundi]|uniref:PaRep2b protein n=1 Tax=Flagellimonas profundi TaxID=2915620 RepID=A0ABS3FJ81_9FLAO|nr:PaRep2b protein [Allomuricauda profundi]MBO0343167.1 PaRep2b protein [Allomuricauda profundi]
MNDSLENFLTDSGEFILDSLVDNEVVKEIPVIGTSINIIKGVKSIRDKIYLNKVKTFIDKLGSINEKQKERLINESKKDQNRRVKFGEALYTSIEHSDSMVKVEYLAVAFEAFLNGDIDNAELRLICHAIKSSFSDELMDVVENENYSSDLKFLVPSGLAEALYFGMVSHGTQQGPGYQLTSIAINLRDAWKKYGNKKSN